MILNCRFLSVWLHHYLFNKHGSCFYFFYPCKQCLNKMPTREPLPLERNPKKRPRRLSGPACTRGQGHGLYWLTGPRLLSVSGTQTVVTTVSSTAPCKAVGTQAQPEHSAALGPLRKQPFLSRAPAPHGGPLDRWVQVRVQDRTEGRASSLAHLDRPHLAAPKEENLPLHVSFPI